VGFDLAAILKEAAHHPASLSAPAQPGQSPAQRAHPTAQAVDQSISE
jgi:hypothetical protein